MFTWKHICNHVQIRARVYINQFICTCSNICTLLCTYTSTMSFCKKMCAQLVKVLISAVFLFHGRSPRTTPENWHCRVVVMWTCDLRCCCGRRKAWKSDPSVVVLSYVCLKNVWVPPKHFSQCKHQENLETFH